MNMHDLLLTVALAASAFLFVGCGSAALKTNAAIASAALEIQSVSGPVIRELRINAGVTAGDEVYSSGGTEAEAQAAAARTTARWQCAIDGHRVYSTAVGAYIDALSLWSVGRSFELTDVIPIVRGVLDSYRVFSSCLRSLGSDALPEVPLFFGLIPPAWSVQ